MGKELIYCGLRFYAHNLIVVTCIQLLHVLHMHSLKLAPQCPTFH